MLTCYDYPTARVEDEAGVDIIFVGDSVGTNVLGYTSPQEVTLEDMVHHVRAVRRGVRNAYLLADLPFRTYESPVMAVESARVLREAGADGIKLEGGLERVTVVEALVHAGFDVCGHIGYTPQSGGSRPRIQGRRPETAWQLVVDALALERAGIFLLVLELMPRQVAGIITHLLQVPTIGIGAGEQCDGQVQIFHDMVGWSDFLLRHVRRFMTVRPLFVTAVTAYCQAVQEGTFPGPEHATDLSTEALEWLRERLQVEGLSLS